MARKCVKDMSRNQQRAVFWRLTHPLPVTKKRINSKMKRRSNRAVGRDRAVTAEHTFDMRDRLGKKKWYEHPNRYDIQNVDTAIAKQQYKARVEKKQLKEKKEQKRKIVKQIHKKKERLKRVKKPEEKQKVKGEIKEREKEKQKIELDIKDVEVGHRKVKQSIHEKQEEKREISYIMKTTQSNNYLECKALRDRVEGKGLAYDQVDWDQLQGSDLSYADRVERLEHQIGKTYTDEELELEGEKYSQLHEEWMQREFK